jgi:hypothetical protein
VVGSVSVGRSLPKSTVKNCYMCYLLFIILCFRAGRPRPAYSFPGGVKKTDGGFRNIEIEMIIGYNWILEQKRLRCLQI